ARGQARPWPDRERDQPGLAAGGHAPDLRDERADRLSGGLAPRADRGRACKLPADRGPLRGSSGPRRRTSDPRVLPGGPRPVELLSPSEEGRREHWHETSRRRALARAGPAVRLYRDG